MYIKKKKNGNGVLTIISGKDGEKYIFEYILCTCMSKYVIYNERTMIITPTLSKLLG